MPPKPFPFTLGADPEFTILIGGRQSIANSFFQAIFRNKYPSGNQGYNVTPNINVGYDGSAATGEIRPAPSNSPAKIVEYLKDGFAATVKEMPIVDLVTSSKRAPIGGHIHIGIENPSQPYLTALHNCIASFYLPLMVGEDIVDLNFRRENGSYGRMSDFRSETHGGARTYEFRTPSAEWLTTPKIALATLAYIGAVYNECYKNPTEFSKKYANVVWRSAEQGNALQSMLLTNYLGPIQTVINDIKKAVRNFEFYQEYKNEIEYLFRPQQVLLDKQKAQFNIVKGWGLEPKLPAQRDILNTKLVNQKADSINLDTFDELVNVASNKNDKNIELFSSELKKRVLTFGWKMNNNYFLFGLRKGIKDFMIFNKAHEFLYHGSQIKTMSDAEAAEDVVQRIDQKFKMDPSADFSDKQSSMRRHVMIGIPYSLRQSSNVRPFLKMIFDLERGKYKPARLLASSLPEDRNNSNKERGKLWQTILMPHDDEGLDDLIVDERSHANQLDHITSLERSITQRLNIDAGSQLNKSLDAIMTFNDNATPQGWTRQYVTYDDYEQADSSS